MIEQCPCDKHLQVAAAAAAAAVVVAVAGFQYNGYLWNHLISEDYCFLGLTAEMASGTVVLAVAAAADAADAGLVPAAFAGALIAWEPYWAGDKPA